MGVYLCSKVNLTDVVILQYSVVTGIGCVVSGTVVDGTAGGEGKTWGRGEGGVGAGLVLG